jgi:hypothetical protein
MALEARLLPVRVRAVQVGTTLGNGPAASSSSRRSVLRQRWIFPVVVGERGLVKRVVMPFSRQIRSNRTSAGYGLANLSVNCFPLSVNTSDDTP